MDKIIAVGLGGFVGAISRYLLTLWMMRLTGRNFPWGTLLVNVLGCLLIGVFMELALQKEWFSAYLRVLLVTGFLGSLTTFSTFGFETLELVEQANWAAAAGNLLLNIVLGLAAVIAGRALISP